MKALHDLAMSDDRLTGAGWRVVVVASVLMLSAPVAGAGDLDIKSAMAAPSLKTPVSPDEATVSPDNSTGDAGTADEQADTGLQSRDPIGDLAYGAYQRGYFLTALDLALPRAESGDPAAQTLIGELYGRGLGVARDVQKAASWYRFAAEAGNREAQFAYANLLIEGKFVPSNRKQARSLMEKAAKAGHVRASFNLAQMIVSEKPDHAGFKQAYPYYLTAAEGGLADAQYAMANIHRQGIGVDFADAVAAREWMQKAAIGGLDSAQVELGIWLANGRGGEANPQRALRWFFRAAAQGNAIAQNRLAKMFLHGIGTKPDLIEAAKWNVLARRAGNRDAELDRMFDNLSDIDRKRAIEAANRISAR